MSLPGLESGDIVGTIIFYREKQQLAQYLFVAALTILVYDWVLNLDLEVAFIWGNSWSWGRAIYHTNRVWPIALLGSTLTTILFIPLPGPSICKPVVYIYSYGAICQTSLVSTMLILRCWAIYDKKRVVWMLAGGLVGTGVASSIIINLLVNRTMFLDNPLPGIFSGCVAIAPNYMWTLYIVPLVFEATLFFSTVWRIYTLSKDFGSTSPLMKTLAQNGMAYFAALVGLMILACIGGTIQAVKIAANISGALTATSSVVGSRMIFSLYQLNERERRRGRAITDTGAGTHNVANGGIITQFAIPLQTISNPSTVHTRSSRQA
ncbi:hypothetical protein B0J17DRAFT_684279 [Rhizoctonia solani]|nr:hypothetical protein B0J17DRAFT_684279 [Rhizoctonia solani]